MNFHLYSFISLKGTQTNVLPATPMALNHSGNEAGGFNEINALCKYLFLKHHFALNCSKYTIHQIQTQYPLMIVLNVPQNFFFVLV